MLAKTRPNHHVLKNHNFVFIFNIVSPLQQCLVCSQKTRGELVLPPVRVLQKFRLQNGFTESSSLHPRHDDRYIQHFKNREQHIRQISDAADVGPHCQRHRRD